MLGGVSQKSIGYVTGYVLKKYNNKKNKEMYEQYEVQPPFQLVSTGIGLNYALDNAGMLQDNMECKFNGRSVGIPRYYTKKLELDPDIIKARGLEGRYNKALAFFERAGIHYNYRFSHQRVLDRFDFDCLYNRGIGYVWKSVLNQQKLNYEVRDRIKKGVL